eukprot:gene15269-15419_t
MSTQKSAFIPQNKDDKSVTRKSGPRDPKSGFSSQNPPFTARSAANTARPAAKAGGKPSPRPARERGESASAPKSKDMVLIFGYHSVREALRSKRRKLIRLIVTEASAERLAPEIKLSGVEVRIVSNDDIITRIPRDAVHQGMLLEARPLEEMDLSDLSGKGIVLVLDQVTDPHNVGAILRTAAAFNVEAIVTTERHSPEMTGILAKSASGGLEHVAIASVVNLARALEELGDMGYQRVGLDSEGPNDLAETPLSSPIALVLGAEGKGLRRLSREKCDVLARLDMPGAIKSLNVSNACAVALSMVHQKLRLPQT